MKRISCRPSMFVWIVAISALGLSILAAQQLAPTEIEGRAAKVLASAQFVSLPLATASIGRLKIDPDEPLDEYMDKPPLRDDREQVEVVARSITFPSVLNQGEFMIRVEFPNATILCLDAAYYAGRTQGLIWAMDRDTVLEHKLYWTIDNANDLFDTCLDIFLREAVAEENSNDTNQLEDVKELLSEQIQLIQEKLRYAKNVKIKRGALSIDKHFNSTVRHLQDERCLSD
jgi:hypothetical protein